MSPLQYKQNFPPIRKEMNTAQSEYNQNQNLNLNLNTAQRACFCLGLLQVGEDRSHHPKLNPLRLHRLAGVLEPLNHLLLSL